MNTKRLPIVVLLLGGLALYLYGAYVPFPRLAGFCADDMFYYLKIAQNAAAGLGPTFDGKNATNGFHPVYFGLLYTAFKVAPNLAPESYVHLALTVLTLATLGTAIFLYSIVHRLVSAQAALLAATLWLLNPGTVRITLAGVEAPLATCSLATLIWIGLVHGTGKREQPGSTIHAISVGALMGVACLCRTDSLLFGCVFGLIYLRRLVGHVGLRLAVVRGATAAITALLVVGPWLAWNIWRFGRITQDSARAISWPRRDLFFSQNDLGELPAMAWRNFIVAIKHLAGLCGVSSIVLVIALIAAVLVLWRLRKPDRHQAEDDVILTAFGGVGVVALFYGACLWYHQSWYYLAPLAWLSLLAGTIHGRLATRFKSPRGKRIGPLVTALLMVTIVSFSIKGILKDYRVSPYYWQRGYHLVALRLASWVPAGSHVGAYNAGIYGYLAKRRVINLDGVVNPAALEAMKRRDLLAYMRREGITHVVDHTSSIDWYQRWGGPDYVGGFIKLGEIQVPSSGGNIVFLRIRERKSKRTP